MYIQACTCDWHQMVDADGMAYTDVLYESLSLKENLVKLCERTVLL